MEKTVITQRCDRCKNEKTWTKDENSDNNPLKIFTIRIALEGSRDDLKTRSADWCKKCCIETSLWIVEKEDQKTEAEKTPLIMPPPTLEDMVRDIVQEEIQAGG